MTSRTARLSLAILFVFTLSACSASSGANQTPSAAGGAIEVAVSKTCTEGTAPACVSVNGEYVILPESFERVGVQDISPSESQGPNTVDVILTETGTKTFHALTKKAAQAGNSERLLLKLGGEIQTAVTVMTPIDNGLLQIGFPPEITAQQAIGLIRAN